MEHENCGNKPGGSGGEEPLSRFYSEYAKSGRSTCKKCKQPISPNSLRLGTIMKNWRHPDREGIRNHHHPDCFFTVQKNARLTSKTVEKTEDLLGFNDLKQFDQDQISKSIDLLREVRRLKKSCTNSKIHERPKTLNKKVADFDPWSPTKSCKLPHIRVTYTNADVLTMSKLSELRAHIKMNEPHIICITEVNPKRESTKFCQDYTLEGYTTPSKSGDIKQTWNHHLCPQLYGKNL